MRRRKFLKYCTGVLGAVYATILAVPGLGFLLSTLKRGQQQEESYHLAKLNDLEPGVPQRFTIIDQRVDAWTKYPSGPIGSVWITKSQDGTGDGFLIYLSASGLCHRLCARRRRVFLPMPCRHLPG